MHTKPNPRLDVTGQIINNTHTHSHLVMCQGFTVQLNMYLTESEDAVPFKWENRVEMRTPAKCESFQGGGC